MTNNDRVGDLYNRRIYSPEAQNACRERIHWLCRHVEGDRILDIGCSQGVVSLILGREGRTVTGVDIEPPVIEAAEAALRDESDPVKKRVSFRVADAFAEDFEPGSFDTVVIGEVLEHLATPQRLLERVAEWLPPGGRVVVSVPHGYEPFDDHKRTIYLLRLVDLLATHFDIAVVEPVFDKYLCAVGVRPAEGQSPAPPKPDVLREWQAASDGALEAVQRAAHDERTALRAERTALRTERTQLNEHAAQQREQIKKLTTASETARRQAQSAQAALQQERSMGIAREQELTNLRGLWKESVQRADELQRRCDKSGTAAKKLDSELQKQRAIFKKEQTERQRASARAERFRSQVETYRLELSLREQEVRYRLGDAFVRAARPSLDTLKLPFRIVKLLLEGLRNVRQRRGQDRELHASAKSSAAPPASKQDSATVDKTTEAAGDLTTLDAISTLAEPFSATPTELQRRSELSIAAVTDEFSWRAWQYEASLHTFTPKTWREALEARKPDLLLIESAWSGVDNSWYFQIRDLEQRGEVIKYYAIPDIIEWCRARSVPTVFYNKEDPPNFDVFIEAAKRFDYVFTSDANCIPDYRKHVGHERVFALPFAAQPRVHNPVMTGARTGSVCFAGTWYSHRHFARHDDANKILRPALDFDLHIFDRMANSGNESFKWPDEYLPAVRGALPYAQMLAAYRRYKMFLNINSVTDSPTMFSRRVFELLACGTPVISAYSTGIEELLGGDVVLMSKDENQTRELLERLLNDGEYRERLSLRGQRKVFGAHTYSHRMQEVLEKIGLPHADAGRPLMTMAAAVEDRAELEAAWQNYERQDYEYKRLVICARDPTVGAAADQMKEGDSSVRVVVAEDETWGPVFREAVSSTPDGYVVACNPGDHYAPHFLTDYAHATAYAPESVIGKATIYKDDNGGEPRIAKRGAEYRVTSHVHPWTLCLSHDAAESAAVLLVGAQTPQEWWSRATRLQERIYATDRFNYVSREGRPKVVAAVAAGADSQGRSADALAAAAV